MSVLTSRDACDWSRQVTEVLSDSLGADCEEMAAHAHPIGMGQSRVEVKVCQDSFDEYEIQGAARTANHEYNSDKCRKRHKICNDASAHSFSDKETFRDNTFITIIDKLKSSSEHRTESYENIDKTFSVLTNFSPNISSSKDSDGIKHLCQKYPDNFPVDFTKEFLPFVEFTSLSDTEKR
ncbi:unnamed protein product [Caretta caretta]